jgi:hypothetical protein
LSITHWCFVVLGALDALAPTADHTRTGRFERYQLHVLHRTRIRLRRTRPLHRGPIVLGVAWPVSA